jgi:hypothetical protein
MKLALVQSASLMLGLSAYYEQGTKPSVALNDVGIVLEVNQGAGSIGPLKYKVGLLDGNTIDWQESKVFGDGVTPSVAMNKSGAVAAVYVNGKVARTNSSTASARRFQDPYRRWSFGGRAARSDWEKHLQSPSTRPARWS